MNEFISVVTTLYRSEVFLDEFISQCNRVLDLLGCDNFEIVMVNDGSPDSSLQKALELQKTNPNIKVVDLSRNFGHHHALMAGMAFAEGELVFLIDCDLEVSPMVLLDLYNTLKNNDDCDVVYGVQKKRKGSWIEQTSGALFYRFFNKLTDTKINPNLLTERLMTRRYVKELLKMGDKNLFLAGMMHWVGFKQTSIVVEKKQRQGQSTYSFSKRFALSLQAITSFSSYPLVLMFKLGITISILSFLLGMFFIVKKLLQPLTVLSGFTMTIVTLLFSVGLIIAAIGILGIYLDKLFNQTKNRPTYIVKKIYK